jgi:hypothetical protein
MEQKVITLRDIIIIIRIPSNINKLHIHNVI